MRTVYFKTCEHPLFENNCEKLKKLIKTNFYIFKLKNPVEFDELNIKMGEDYNEIWWVKEDRKLLFMKITLKGICMYLSGNKTKLAEVQAITGMMSVSGHQLILGF